MVKRAFHALINPAIPVDLETIVLKAISKAPQDRYSSAQALADDLQRFLEDKPILARRPTLLDRVRKIARRHPGVVVTGFAMLGLLSIGLLVHNRIISPVSKLVPRYAEWARYPCHGIGSTVRAMPERRSTR